MKIETKFDINNLIAHKFQQGGNIMNIMEVMEIETVTCYAGTQNFYICRLLVLEKVFKNSYSNEGKFRWRIAHSIGKEDFASGWKKYREDEMIEAPQELIEIVMGNITEGNTAE